MCIYLHRTRYSEIPRRTTFYYGTDIEELDSGETCTYLWQDEDIGFKGELNKQRVTEEYLRRARQIWNSELYSHNKVVAQNIFAIPVLTPTFDILEWTKQEKYSQHVPVFISVAI